MENNNKTNTESSAMEKQNKTKHEKQHCRYKEKKEYIPVQNRYIIHMDSEPLGSQKRPDEARTIATGVYQKTCQSMLEILDRCDSLLSW